MPTGLPPTPWIRSYDVPELYLQGYGRGSEVAQAQARIVAARQEAQARLAAAQQEAERDAQMKMQIHQQNALVEQQKIAIENQYRQTQLGLAKQKADEQAMMDQWKIKQAATTVASRMELQKAIQSGEDPVKAMMRLGPSSGLPMGAMATLAKSQEKVEIPESVKTYTDEKGERYYLKGKEIVHIPSMRMPVKGALSQQERAQISSLKLEEKALQSQLDRWALTDALTRDISTVKPNDRPRVQKLKDQAMELDQKIKELRAERKRLEGFSSDVTGGDDSDWKQIGGFKVRVRK